MGQLSLHCQVSIVYWGLPLYKGSSGDIAEDPEKGEALTVLKNLTYTALFMEVVRTCIFPYIARIERHIKAMNISVRGSPFKSAPGC